ncbi:MAG: amidohydrolase family protein, partial [Candidatus Aminicenantaceae bacterium]
FGITTLEHATGIAEALSKNQKFEDAPPFQTISHRSWIYADKSKYDSLINFFIKKNVYITANLTLYKIFISNPEEIANNSHLRFMPEQYKKRWKHHLSGHFQKVIRQKESWIITKKRLEEFLIRFKNKGGKVLAGTDAPYPYLIPGFSLHRELELLIQSGFTPMEALQTATKYPAEALHQENNLGTIEEGKTANLILLDANPLEDIRNTEKINIVIKEGIIIDREKLKRSLLGKS